MKLIHFHNVSCFGDWDTEKFLSGRKWFFDLNTAINDWLPQQKDPRDIFAIIVIDVKPEDVYKSNTYMDNSSFLHLITIAKNQKKMVVEGDWDAPGSKQYLLIDYDSITFTPTTIYLHEVEAFLHSIL